jgi:hypothetical protein
MDPVKDKEQWLSEQDGSATLVIIRYFYTNRPATLKQVGGGS